MVITSLCVRVHSNGENIINLSSVIVPFGLDLIQITTNQLSIPITTSTVNRGEIELENESICIFGSYVRWINLHSKLYDIASQPSLSTLICRNVCNQQTNVKMLRFISTHSHGNITKLQRLNVLQIGVNTEHTHTHIDMHTEGESECGKNGKWKYLRSSAKNETNNF